MHHGKLRRFTSLQQVFECVCFSQEKILRKLFWSLPPRKAITSLQLVFALRSFCSNAHSFATKSLNGYRRTGSQISNRGSLTLPTSTQNLTKPAWRIGQVTLSQFLSKTGPKRKCFQPQERMLPHSSVCTSSGHGRPAFSGLRATYLRRLLEPKPHVLLHGAQSVH